MNYKTLGDKQLEYIFRGYNFKTKPMRHQLCSLAFALDHERGAFFHDVGVGKSYIALMAMRLHGVRRVLIVCPNSVVPSWRDQIRTHTDDECVELVGERNAREMRLELGARWSVINYEGLRVLWGQKAHSNFGKGNKFVINQSALDAARFDGLIVDESHYVANADNVTSEIVGWLSDGVRYAYLLTGTPIAKNMLDLWGQFYTLDCGATLGQSLDKFRDRYFVKVGYKWVPKRGCRDRILSLIAPKVLSYARDECFDLPPVTRQRRWVNLTAEQERLQHEMLMLLRTELNERKITAANVLVRTTKLAQIAGGFILDSDRVHRLAENPKLAELDALLPEIRSKCIIYHRFVEEGRMICELLTRRRLGHVALRGEIVDKPTAIADFQNNPHVQFLVANSACGGVGLNFQMARVCIFYSNDYSGATTRRQCEGRVHRLGQTHPVLFIDILADNSIDRSILDVMADKQSLADSVLNFVRKFA